jgi:hypothetical protein
MYDPAKAGTLNACCNGSGYLAEVQSQRRNLIEEGPKEGHGVGRGTVRETSA